MTSESTEPNALPASPSSAPAASGSPDARSLSSLWMVVSASVPASSVLEGGGVDEVVPVGRQLVDELDDLVPQRAGRDEHDRERGDEQAREHHHRGRTRASSRVARGPRRRGRGRARARRRRRSTAACRPRARRARRAGRRRAASSACARARPPRPVWANGPPCGCAIRGSGADPSSRDQIGWRRTAPGATSVTPGDGTRPAHYDLMKCVFLTSDSTRALLLGLSNAPFGVMPFLPRMCPWINANADACRASIVRIESAAST